MQNDWDKDIARLKAEVAGLIKQQKVSNEFGIRGLLARKIKLIQLEIDCDRWFEKVCALANRNYLLLPREQTFLHWTRIFLEQVTRLRTLRSEVFSRKLWLGLLQTRLLGVKANRDSTTALGTSELMELSIRRSSLLKTEKYLAEALVKLKSRRLELVKRYETLPIVDANQLASHSLNYRLGKNLDDALSSPILTILGEYLRTGTYPVVAPREIERVQKLQQKYERDERAIKSKVIGDRKGLTSEKFEKALKQLDDLQLETLTAYQELKGRAPEPLKPSIRV